MADFGNKLKFQAFSAVGAGDLYATSTSMRTFAPATANYLLASTNSNSGSLVVTVNTRTGLHQYSVTRSCEYAYDFATDGGAVGNITLRGPQLPSTARVFGGFWEPTAAFTSGGAAQISLGTATGTPANLLAAAVLGTNGTTGIKAIIPVFTAATTVSLAAAASPVIGVTVAALTAGTGKLTLFVATAEADTTT